MHNRRGFLGSCAFTFARACFLSPRNGVFREIPPFEVALSGILGYWDFGHANSGSAEGFNTKVRLLMKQSYGLRDFKYLKLKIMDLPSRKIRVSI